MPAKRTIPARVKSPEIIYSERVIRNVDGCWGWNGMMETRGYGYFESKPNGVRLKYRIHRYALEQALGFAIPDGWEACHTCDTPTCTKNDDPGVYYIRGIYRPRFGHLWLGTHADNMADMWLKGRGQHGERGSQAILTNSDVQEIRRLLACGRRQYEIAPIFNINRKTVADIQYGRTWVHLPNLQGPCSEA
jgi:hypothetical protein